MWNYTHSDELYHYGTKGMKWGVRRYQNKDGSLTNAGKKRYDRDLSEHDTDWAKKNPNANPERWVKEDLSRTKRLVDETSQMTGKLKRAADDSIKNNPKVKMDLSSMSDKEMRDAINRALLERQYNDMFAPQKSTKGREYASKTLEIAGNVLGVTGSALAIALAIKDLRSKVG